MREIKFRAWDGEEFKFFDYAKDDIYRCGSFKDLQQYTGLKDKNGKEMYEGDILCNRAFDIPEEELVLNKVKWVNTPYTAAFDFGTASACHLVEIIGNIHENLELLEGKDGKD